MRQRADFHATTIATATARTDRDRDFDQVAPARAFEVLGATARTDRDRDFDRDREEIDDGRWGLLVAAGAAIAAGS